MNTYDQIIELLPSLDLKAKIKETNHDFNENELLQIILTYSPTFELRISLLENFASITTGDTSALANAYIQYDRKNWRDFVDDTEGYVYELHIKECPNSTEERYLCASYKSALACIDRFYRKYDFASESDEVRYTIRKRKVFSESDDFDEDMIAECVLGADKNLLEISDFRYFTDCEADMSCYECKKICPRRCELISFPCFVSNYAIIKYIDFNRRERYGVNICLNGCKGNVSELYVIPLHSDTIRFRQFNTDFFEHDHVPLPLATLVSPEDLDNDLRNDYFAFVEFLNSRK